MPVFGNRVVLELVRNVGAFLGVEGECRMVPSRERPQAPHDRRLYEYLGVDLGW